MTNGNQYRPSDASRSRRSSVKCVSPLERQRPDDGLASAVAEATAAGLIRPHYASMRDFQRARVYRLEGTVIPRWDVCADGVSELITEACKRYRVQKSPVHYDPRRNKIAWVGCNRHGHGIVLRPAGMTTVTVLHECAHYIIAVYFPGKFEPAHGPWFASVAFDLYRNLLWSDLTVAGSGIQFAVSPDTANVPAMVKAQAEIWKPRAPLGSDTIIDPELI